MMMMMMMIGTKRSNPRTTSRVTCWSFCLLALALFLADVQAFSPLIQVHQQSCQSRGAAPLYAASSKEGDGDWFKQQQGESDMAFIKRITSKAPPPPSPKDKAAAQNQQASGKTGNGYKRIEDWEAEQQEAQKNGTLSWEEKVQFDGQRFGNQVRQNDILMRQIKYGS
mmetsp:Transcript_10745/g.30607  ORF Transcript_10745/g.30607 Transcript_10745/m.30607 type:complete len:168 (-) Transcript_10745:112-615(-)